MAQVQIDLQRYEKTHWTQADKQKAELAVDFVQLIMNDHNFDEVLRRHAGLPYKQHNRGIADGIEGVVETVRDLVKNAPEFSYDIKHIYVDGDCVILHSHATLKAKHRGDDRKGFNIVDTWKVVDGRLAEHWDAVQGISLSMRLYMLATGGKIRNNNGIF